MTRTQIKLLRSLQQKKFREQEGLYIAEGFKITGEALRTNPSDVAAIYYTTGLPILINELEIPGNIAVYEVNSADFQKISILKNPQGILAVMKMPVQKKPLLTESDDLILLLDSIRDPGNLGTIIRLADWFGIQKIICSTDTVECYNPKVVQATMGSVFRVKMYYLELFSFLKSMQKDHQYSVYGSSLKGENIYNYRLRKPAIIVLGSESHGISAELEKMIHTSLLIPNFSRSDQPPDSLNVSLAAAIICSEFRRNG